jgi:hypothetical protein
VDDDRPSGRRSGVMDILGHTFDDDHNGHAMASMA